MIEEMEKGTLTFELEKWDTVTYTRREVKKEMFCSLEE